MSKTKSKYIIKFAVSNNNKRYVRRRYKNNAPMLTPMPHMVDIDCTFDNKADTVVVINGMCRIAQKHVLRLEAEMVKFSKGKLSKASYYYKDVYSDLRKYKKRADNTNYTLEKYTPSFVCNTERKRVNNTWKDDGSAKTFCSCCGSNIYYGDYAMLGSAKVCPFCIKGLGEHANIIIEKLKKQDAKIEDDYNCSVFVANM
tara:strand:+ start:3574 stop:4173 length:600 start_codon:yes stop_codon:yes gene_type:complete